MLFTVVLTQKIFIKVRKYMYYFYQNLVFQIFSLCQSSRVCELQDLFLRFAVMKGVLML